MPSNPRTNYCSVRSSLTSAYPSGEIFPSAKFLSANTMSLIRLRSSTTPFAAFVPFAGWSRACSARAYMTKRCLKSHSCIARPYLANESSSGNSLVGHFSYFDCMIEHCWTLVWVACESPSIQKVKKIYVYSKHSLGSVAIIEFQIWISHYWLQKQLKAKRSCQLPAKRWLPSRDVACMAMKL